MRYETKSDLPESLRDYLPDKLQDMYLEAYKKAWEKYEDYRGGDASQESVAHRDAMHDIEQEYTYVEETGKWYPKGEEPKEEEEEEGLLDTITDALPGS